MPMPSQKPVGTTPVQTAQTSDPVRRHEIIGDFRLVAEMREHLRVARPTSGNEALRLLRAAYPDVPLADRVRVAGEMNRHVF